MSILKRQWFVTLMLFPFLMPYTIIDFFPYLEPLYDATKVVWCVLILFMYLYRRKITPFIIVFSLYHLSLLLSIAIGPGYSSGTASTIFKYISAIAICILFEMCFQESVENALRSYIHFYTPLVVMNLVFLFIYPEGIVTTLAPWVNYYEGCHFIGLRNGMIAYHLPYIVSLVIYSRYRERKMTAFPIAMIIVSCCNIFITWSATGVVALLIMLTYLLFIQQSRLRKFVNFINTFIASVLIYIAIVVIRLQSLFQPFIEGFLNRSITLTGRTLLWDYVTRYIYERPFMGWGDYAVVIISNAFNTVSAHNCILDILIRGGFAALTLWISMLIICGIQLQRVKAHLFSTLIVVALFAIQTAYLAEYYSTYLALYILYVCAYHTPEIIRQYEKKDNSIKNKNQTN